MVHNSITERKTPARRMRGTGYPKPPVRRLLRQVERVLRAAGMHDRVVRDGRMRALDSDGGTWPISFAGLVPCALICDLWAAWEALDGPREREREDAEAGAS